MPGSTVEASERWSKIEESMRSALERMVGAESTSLLTRKGWLGNAIVPSIGASYSPLFHGSGLL